jgi:hypothetical protein
MSVLSVKDSEERPQRWLAKERFTSKKKAAKEGKPTTSTSQLADADPKDIQINLRAVSVGTLARNNIPRIALIVPCR